VKLRTRPPAPSGMPYDRVIDQHRSSPSVVMWVNQNEGWSQYDQTRIANEVKAYDPSRLVNNLTSSPA
jgi:beta-galactosidase/beta-glucuronidase